MTDITVKVDAASALRALAVLEVEAPLRQDIAELVANEVVLPTLAKEPKASGKKQPFRSDKSRRFFFAALRAGQIQVPYQRTGFLGARWLRQPFSGGMALRSEMDYSEIVLGPNQAAYFKGTWPTTDAIARACEQPAADMAGTLILKRVTEA